MGKAVYLNNYRGFTKQYVDLEDVTFLIGENSAGKTSFLSAINLLSTADRDLDFNSVELKLGEFPDIVSINAQDRSFFDIGFVRTQDTGFRLQLSKFVEGDNSLPILSKLIYARYDQLIGIEIRDGKVTYHHEAIRGGPTEKSLMRRAVSLLERDFEHKFHMQIPMAVPASVLKMLLGGELGEKLDIQESSTGFLEAWTVDSILYKKLNWIAPIRTQPRRTYDSTEAREDAVGHHIPHVIRREVVANRASARSIRKSLREFGKSSGLFSNIAIREFSSKRSESSPFELMVELNNHQLRINAVGYGVSQSLPIAVELIRFGKGSSYAIQQPEVHLHPKGQAALGDLFHKFSLVDNKEILVETHSDYILDRFRLAQMHSKKKVKSTVLYFTRTKNGNKIAKIPIDDAGRYSQNQPKSFRSFFLKEQLRLLDL